MVHHGNITDKFSKDFFVKRIQELQQQIQTSLPDVDTERKDCFTNACKNVQTCLQAKAEAQAYLDKLRKSKADKELIDEAAARVAECESAENAAEETMALSGNAILQSVDVLSTIDEKSLLECTILIQASPQGLAKWVAEDRPTNENLLSSFLEDTDWMRQMIIAGGAAKGMYGLALQLHSQLLEKIALEPVTPMRHKLALAVAVEHATPIRVFKDKNCVIDPINRFWHYVHAYESDELDEYIENFSVWELRMVVDSDAHDDDLKWGREYLKAYRPDQVLEENFQWRYAVAVRSDVGYKQPDHEFNNYKELISAGGKCGPRAFFGRFICKAWGTPTWGVRQPGHAAMSRWTPSGWTVCLGAAFVWSWWADQRYGNDKRRGPDFLEETEARAALDPLTYFRSMQALECLAECMGEKIEEHVKPEKLWRSLSLAKRYLLSREPSQRSLHKTTLRKNLERGSDEQPCNLYDKITEISSGTILVPAPAFVEPRKPDKRKVMTMMSFLGGSQLHLESDGSVSYEMPQCIPDTNYTLAARIVTIHRNQVPLFVSVDPGGKRCGGATTTDLQVDIPYTGGEWQTTIPVAIRLGPGSVFKIYRVAACHGITIKDFVLVAVD